MLPDASDIIRRVESKATQKAGKAVLKFFLDNYTNEGYYLNGTFTPWSRRRNPENKKPLLWDTGDMKKSFHIQFGTNSFKILNTAPYSKYHQGGTPNMDKRPILYDDKKIEEIIETIVDEEFNKIFNKKNNK